MNLKMKWKLSIINISDSQEACGSDESVKNAAKQLHFMEKDAK